LGSFSAALDSVVLVAAAHRLSLEAQPQGIEFETLWLE